MTRIQSYSRRMGWVALLALCGAGCTAWKSTRGQPLADATRQVKTGGACMDLGEGHQPAYQAEEFLGKVTELRIAERSSSARSLASQYPDLCQATLRSATNAEASGAAMQLIAAIHDEQTGLKDTPLSWAQLMRDR